MEALLGYPDNNIQNEQKWHWMIIISMVFHAIVFSVFLFVPESIPTGKINRVIYEVDLVDNPSKILKQSVTRTRKTVAAQIPSKAIPTKRISTSKVKGKPVVIAKKTVNIKAEKIKSTEGTSAKLLDQAMERIAPSSVKEGDLDTNQTVSRIDPQPVNRPDTGSTGIRSTDGIIMEIYKSEIKNLVYNNWTYVSLVGPDSTIDLSAVVVLKVDKNGSILQTTMARSSGDAKYDQSVLKAIKKSDPLLPFPEGYRKTHEEIEINFNTRDLLNQ